MEREFDGLAWLLDDTFRIPGTGRRFGLEPIIGFIPGIGDLVSGGLGLYLISRALSLRLPGIVIARMVFNTLLDFVLGAVPVLGDLVDFVYKSNARNMALIREYATDPGAPTRQHWLFLGGAGLIIIGVLALLITAAIWVVSTLAQALQDAFR